MSDKEFIPQLAYGLGKGCGMQSHQVAKCLMTLFNDAIFELISS